MNFRVICAFVAIFILSWSFADAQEAKSTKTDAVSSPPKPGSVENSVVKIFSTARYPDFYKPWAKQAPSESTGTGVVIERKRILSNAHVVNYASQIQIQANQAGDKIPATVEAVAPGIDLAILKVEDESFFDTHPPLPRASKLPEIKDAVLAYGYPGGGTSISITKGIISRIEFDQYNFPVSGLRIQIDAAINPGNSGGPVMAGDKMIGLAFSHLGGADNIGYIIPCEEIEMFLRDIEDGHYDGKPAMFDFLQTLENPALRPFLKINKTVQGIIVHKPFSSDPSYPLKEWDIITRVGDTPVDNEGMIKWNSNLRLGFVYLVQSLAKNGKVPLTVVREGKEAQIQLPVSAVRPTVIGSLEGKYPPYFVYGPLAFSIATRDLIGGVADGTNPQWVKWLGERGSPLLTRIFDKPAFDGEAIVIVSSPLFPHKLSLGYSDPTLQVVKAINGHRIKNLGHLVEVLRDSKAEFIKVEFDSRGEDETMIFPRAEMLSATDDILTDNGVRSQGSPDMMAIWNAKVAKKD